jgi:5-methylcytosine-specific restriction endonuclease McrA
MDESTTHLRACTKCGESKPATTEFFHKTNQRKDGIYAHCKACHRLMVSKNSRQNLEGRRENARQWRAENIEKERERHRLARLADPDKHRAKVRASYWKHHEKRLAARRLYGKINRAKETAYARFHLVQRRELYQEIKARKRAQNYGILAEKIDYRLILDRDGLTCHICLGDVPPNEVSFDHIIPLSLGGPHALENVAVAHWACNRAKNIHTISRRYPVRSHE